MKEASLLAIVCIPVILEDCLFQEEKLIEDTASMNTSATVTLSQDTNKFLAFAETHRYYYVIKQY